MKVTEKSGFRGLTVEDIEPTDPPGTHKWTVAVDGEGVKTFTCTTDGGNAAVEYGATDVQPHNGCKTGSTVKHWRDANGIQHTTITEM